MEKRKNYKMYIIMGCIFLLLLFGGIGLLFWNHQLENKKLEQNVESSHEKKNIGNYVCQTNDCRVIINKQNNSLLIYDSSYYFWNPKTNRFMEIKEINCDNILDYQIIDHYVKIEYKNNIYQVYNLNTGEINGSIVEEDNMIVYDNTSWSLYSIKEEKLLNTYHFLTENFLEGRSEIEVEKKNEKLYYIVHYIENLEETVNEIYTNQNYYTKDYIFNIVNDKGNMILTEKDISPITGCGDFNAGYEYYVSSFIEMDELGNVVRKSHDYQSILTIRNSKNLDFFLAIQENQLKLYSLEEEELYNFGNWDGQKNVEVGEDENSITFMISEVGNETATLYTYHKENHEVTFENTTNFCQR